MYIVVPGNIKKFISINKIKAILFPCRAVNFNLKKSKIIVSPASLIQLGVRHISTPTFF